MDARVEYMLIAGPPTEMSQNPCCNGCTCRANAGTSSVLWYASVRILVVMDARVERPHMQGLLLQQTKVRILVVMDARVELRQRS